MIGIILEYLGAVVTTCAVVTTLMGLCGIAPYLWQSRDTSGFHLSAMVVWFAVGGAGRSGYWGLLRYLLPEEWWPALRDALGGIQANMIFDAALWIAALHLLKLTHLLLAPRDRKARSMWTAWYHPRRFGEVLTVVCKIKKRNNRP